MIRRLLNALGWWEWEERWGCGGIVHRRTVEDWRRTDLWSNGTWGNRRRVWLRVKT